MNKKIIVIFITLTISSILIECFSILVIRYHFKKKQNSLEVEERIKKESKSEEEEEEEEKKEKKEKEEEIKSKEKEEEKEKEEKEKEKDNNKENAKDTPWQFTWKGEVCSSLTSALISATISWIATYIFLKEKLKNSLCEDSDHFNIYFLFLLIIFEIIIFPLFYAFKKFGKRNYFQRFLNVFVPLKMIIDIVIISITAFGIYQVCTDVDEEERYTFSFSDFFQMFILIKRIKKKSIINSYKNDFTKYRLLNMVKQNLKNNE